MVELVFGDLTFLDIVLAAFTGFAGSVVLATAYFMSNRGMPNWKPRKMVHVSMSSVIGLTLVLYSNLSGPMFAAGLFLTVLLYAWAHKSDLISELLIAGSREGETGLNTFASGLMGMVAFGAAFLLFLPRPEIFVSAILAVSWGDAAGEVFGRPHGGKIVKRKFRKKSFEGTVAVFLFTVFGMIAAMIFYSVDTLPWVFLSQIAIIGLVVTFIELISIGWTDNFFIPLVTAYLMWILIYPGMVLVTG
ncbi:MAG: hypothetical protein RTU30_12870 [Candidatus Thorarchaeota archaeon]